MLSYDIWQRALPVSFFSAASRKSRPRGKHLPETYIKQNTETHADLTLKYRSLKNKTQDARTFLQSSQRNWKLVDLPEFLVLFWERILAFFKATLTVTSNISENVLFGESSHYRWWFLNLKFVTLGENDKFVSSSHHPGTREQLRWTCSCSSWLHANVSLPWISLRCACVLEWSPGQRAHIYFPKIIWLSCIVCVQACLI